MTPINTDEGAVKPLAPDPLVLTVDEVAGLLRISRGLAFAGVRNGTIPHLRIGRRILIPQSALAGLLEQR